MSDERPGKRQGKSLALCLFEGLHSNASAAAAEKRADKVCLQSGMVQ